MHFPDTDVNFRLACQNVSNYSSSQEKLTKTNYIPSWFMSLKIILLNYYPTMCTIHFLFIKAYAKVVNLLIVCSPFFFNDTAL